MRLKFDRGFDFTILDFTISVSADYVRVFDDKNLTFFKEQKAKSDTNRANGRIDTNLVIADDDGYGFSLITKCITRGTLERNEQNYLNMVRFHDKRFSCLEYNLERRKAIKHLGIETSSRTQLLPDEVNLINEYLSHQCPGLLERCGHEKYNSCFL